MTAQTLNDIAAKHGTDKAWRHHYLDFYQANLPGPEFTGRLLEIGVYEGASLRMWREFYPEAESIVGIDIIDTLPVIEGVSARQINSSDITALRELGSFDIIVDDGSHMTLDQQVSFHWLYNHQLNDGGLYVMEDLHTSHSRHHTNSKYTTLEFLETRYDAVYFDQSRESITAIIPAGQTYH